MIQGVALYLKDKITESFQQAEDLPWPPSDDFLRQIDVLPTDLERFLNFLIAGKAENHSPKVQRMVNSLRQDICRAVTRGQWNLPKHLLICMTLRHTLLDGFVLIDGAEDNWVVVNFYLLFRPFANQ